MNEINPNHPVTREVHNEWHKIVALMMIHFGIKEFFITEKMIMDLPRDIAVVFDSRVGIGDPVVRIAQLSEVMKRVKKEGGLPV
jgi:hypothetical protein